MGRASHKSHYLLTLTLTLARNQNKNVLLGEIDLNLSGPPSSAKQFNWADSEEGAGKLAAPQAAPSFARRPIIAEQ